MSFFANRTPFLGALDDLRTRKERELDYQFDEIVASADEVKWVEKTPDQWRKFPISDQDGSGSCVAQSASKMLGVLQFLRDGAYVPLSATDIYQRRANKNIGDGQGMGSNDVFTILRTHGATLEALMPSENMTDAQMDAIKRKPYYDKVADIFKLDNYVQYRPRLDFDKVASTIQKTNKALMVWFRFDQNEWGKVPTIKTSNPKLHHSVTAVDVGIYKGQEGIIIDDSWGIDRGFAGQRFITREFFENRNTFSAYPLRFVGDGALPVKPKHQWSRVLRYGARADQDVQKLQDVLKFEGLFPANVDSTGTYLEVTRKAVLAFQTKYQVATRSELVDVNGKIVGAKTLAVLNSLYGY